MNMTPTQTRAQVKRLGHGVYVMHAKVKGAWITACGRLIHTQCGFPYRLNEQDVVNCPGCLQGIQEEPILISVGNNE